MAGEWYCKIDDEILGPLDLIGIRTLAMDGGISSLTLVRKGTQGDFYQAHRYKGLLSDGPPIPPKPPAPIATASVDELVGFAAEPYPDSTFIPPIFKPKPQPKPKPEFNAFYGGEPKKPPREFWSLPFGLTPVKIISSVLIVIGAVVVLLSLLVGVVMLVGAAVMESNTRRQTSGGGGLALILSVLIVPGTMFLSGIATIAIAELMSRFCLIEEHLREIRGQK